MTVANDTSNWAERFVGATGFAIFERDIRERTSALFTAALNASEAASVFDLNRLQAVMLSDEPPVSSTDLFNGTHLVHLTDVLHRTSKSAYETMLEQLEQGVTLRLRKLEAADRQVREITDSLASIFNGKVSTNLYLTPAVTEGFRPHFDNTDVFVLQIYGQKEWKLFDRYSNQQDLPVRETPWDPARYAPMNEGRLVTLKPGDVLYIPRGGMHAAACTVSASMHLTFSLDPATTLDVLTDELRCWAEVESSLRQRASTNTAEFSIPDLLRQLAERIEARDANSISNSVSAVGSCPAAAPASLDQFVRELTARRRISM